MKLSFNYYECPTRSVRNGIKSNPQIGKEMQWRSEIRTYWSDFRWSSFQMVGLQLWLQPKPFKNQTIRNPDAFVQISKSLTKQLPFVPISNGWVAGFQIPLKIRTICISTFSWPFKMKTRFQIPTVSHLVLKYSRHVSTKMSDELREAFNKSVVFYCKLNYT